MSPEERMEEGIRLYKEGQYLVAYDWFSTNSKQLPDFAQTAYYLALCALRLKLYDESLLYLEQVLTHDIHIAQLYQCKMLTGLVYERTQRPRMAEYEFQGLIEDGFESAKVYSALGHVTFLQEKIPSSIAALEKALRIEPDSATVNNSMGYVLASSNNNLTQAVVFCRKAVSQDPQNAVYLDSLGYALLKLGNRTEALSTLRKALHQEPKNQLIQSHLREAAK